MAGDLPCTREVAATLAALSMHLDDHWPANFAEAHDMPETSSDVELAISLRQFMRESTGHATSVRNRKLVR